jgi:hypothetical protein
MKKLCVVPCGNAKIWDKYPDASPTPARYVKYVVNLVNQKNIALIGRNMGLSINNHYF